MAKALGFRDFRGIMKKFQAGGASLEKKYRDEKRSFVQIELLAVRTKYQGKGFLTRPIRFRWIRVKVKEIFVIFISKNPAPPGSIWFAQNS